MSIGTGLAALFAVGALILFAISLLKSTWHVAEPNEALVIAGRKKAGDTLGFRIVAGAGAFVIPGLQKVRKLSLKMHEAQIQSSCVTQQGIPVQVKGVAIYKVGDDPESIANAARRFLDQPEKMDTNIQSVLDGHLRSIIGGMTVEDLIRSRDALTGETLKAAGVDMAKLGIVIDTLQISDIADPSGYIQSLAAPHVAEVKMNARIAAAQRDQDATKAEQDAAANKAQFTRDSETKQAQYAADVESAKAKAAQAGPLADALAKQDVVRAATATAELAAAQKEMELQASVRKPADAEAYRITVTANAQRDASIAEAQAEAKKVELAGLADATAKKAIGDAEGSAIQAKALAEAAGISARAKALAENQDAVIGQQIAEKMPDIVQGISSAFSKVGNVTMLSQGSSGINDFISTVVGLGATLVPVVQSAVKTIKTAASSKDE